MASERSASRSSGRDTPIPLRPVAQYLGNAALHCTREVHAARAPVDVAEGEAGIGDGRVIEDRDEPRRIGHHGPVEQRLVPVR